MDATKPLLQKAQQYLRSAAVLLEMGDLDSCASRAYFAMFYAAQAALAEDGYNATSSQRGIRSAFNERFVASGRFPERAGHALNRAYDLQQTGDYARHRAVNQDDAEHTLQEAEAFVNSISHALHERPSAGAS